MILLDINILLYAYDSRSPKHREAKSWLEDQFSGTETVLIPWTTVLGFLRITTSNKILKRPFLLENAVDIVATWLELPHVQLLQPLPSHWHSLKTMLLEYQAKGNLVPDAHLAMLALENGATVCSTDRDFSRFRAVKWLNPLS